MAVSLKLSKLLQRHRSHESVFTSQIVTWLLYMECKHFSFEHTLNSFAPGPAVTVTEYKIVHRRESPRIPWELNEWQNNKTQKGRESHFSFSDMVLYLAALKSEVVRSQP